MSPEDHLPHIKGMTQQMYAPAPDATPAIRTTGWLSRMWRETGYLLTGFPLAIASFVILLTGLVTSVSLLIIWVGVPLAVLTLAVARVFATIERSRLRALGMDIPRAYYRRVQPGWRGWLGTLRDPQSWLDTLHGLLIFPIAIFTFVVTVTWWAGAAGGLTYWFWSQWLPEDDADSETLAELLNWGVSDSALNAIIGAVLLVTLPFVIHAMAVLQAGFGRIHLGNEHMRELQERVDTLTASRAAVVEAEASSLRKLERDIHDGPQQRLVRLGMDLSIAERRLADNPEKARDLLAEARTQTAEALAELRALSRGIAPPILTDRGLRPALAAVAARSTVRADLDVRLPEGERLPASVENAAYFVVSEALANVAKHSTAEHVHIRVTRDGNMLYVEVEDDGQGGAHPAKGHGLAGLVDRVEGVDGALTVTSPDGGPTIVRADIPLTA